MKYSIDIFLILTLINFISFYLQICILNNIEILKKFFKLFDRNVIKLLCLFYGLYELFIS